RGHKNNYYADRFGIDVLTDTTERSPTYCTPPFRKFDDATASESWAFLFLPDAETASAWERILRRPPCCVEWAEPEVRQLVAPAKVGRTVETIRKISGQELLRFKIGEDGLPCRELKPGDSAIGIFGADEAAALFSPEGFLRRQFGAARNAGAQIATICFGAPP